MLIKGATGGEDICGRHPILLRTGLSPHMFADAPGEYKFSHMCSIWHSIWQAADIYDNIGKDPARYLCGAACVNNIGVLDPFY